MVLLWNIAIRKYRMEESNKNNFNTYSKASHDPRQLARTTRQSCYYIKRAEGILQNITEKKKPTPPQRVWFPPWEDHSRKEWRSMALAAAGSETSGSEHFFTYANNPFISKALLPSSRARHEITFNQSTFSPCDIAKAIVALAPLLVEDLFSKSVGYLGVLKASTSFPRTLGISLGRTPQKGASTQEGVALNGVGSGRIRYTRFCGQFFTYVKNPFISKALLPSS
jgi:hypothetical protein